MGSFGAVDLRGGEVELVGCVGVDLVFFRARARSKTGEEQFSRDPKRPYVENVLYAGLLDSRDCFSVPV